LKRIISIILGLALATPALALPNFPFPGGGSPGPNPGICMVFPALCAPTPPPVTPPVTPPPTPEAAAPAQQQSAASTGSGRSDVVGKIAAVGVAIYFYAAMCNHSQWRVELYDAFMWQIESAALQAALDAAFDEQLGGNVTAGERLFAKHCGLGIGHLFPTGEVTAPLPGEYVQ
jgi:hypothetical protein